jgi:ATP sulfurylase
MSSSEKKRCQFCYNDAAEGKDICDNCYSKVDVTIMNKGLRDLIELGRNNYKARESNPEEVRKKIRSRRWRALVGEFLHDIHPCIHRYVNLEMPAKWKTYNTNFLGKLAFHEFSIEIPKFLPITAIYRQQLSSMDWVFYAFEIRDLHSKIHTEKLFDLPLILAIAQEFKRPPEKSKVVIEEINGGLDENAKLIKIEEVKPSKKDSYKLTMMDFYASGSEYYGFEAMGG